MATKTEKALKEYGCDCTVLEFRETIAEIKQQMFPVWSEEQVVTHWEEAGEFIRMVRKSLHCPRLASHLILMQLLNMHKYELSGM